MNFPPFRPADLFALVFAVLLKPFAWVVYSADAAHNDPCQEDAGYWSNDCGWITAAAADVAFGPAFSPPEIDPLTAPLAHNLRYRRATVEAIRLALLRRVASSPRALASGTEV